jgi:hypothetical protein
MKRPISIYLPAVPYNRLAGYIANALDGQGSFSGLIRFIEEHNYVGNVENARDMFATSIADEPFSELSRLPVRQYWQPLAIYQDRWAKFASALPWYEANPVAAHMLGLFVLRHHSDLWATEYALKPEGPPEGLAHWARVAEAQMFMRPDESMGFEADESFDHASTAWRKYRPIFRRNRIELTGQEGSEAASLHLDPSHHSALHGALGNRFFERLVHSLLTQLENTDAGIDIEPESRFLELGLNGVSGDALEETAARIAADYTDVRIAYKAKDRQAALAEQGFTSLEDPRLLNLALEETYTRIGEEESIAHLDTGVVLADDLDLDALTVLRLGHRLGLIDEHPIAALPGRIVQALRDRHGITELTPSRENAFRLMSSSVTDDAAQTFRNAVDMHMWGLFHLYAKSCVPSAIANDPRLYRSTLSTLAEPRLFPRQATLEAFTGTSVSKEPGGAWSLRKGRSVVRELTNHDAIAVGNVLIATVSVHDPVTDTGWLGVAQSPHSDELKSLRSRSIPVGVEVLDRAKCHLDEQGGQTRLAAKKLTTELLTGKTSGPARKGK